MVWCFVNIIRKICKRSFDFFFSLLGIVILLPIFIAVSFWIKVDSEGPVLFRQQRVGQYGRLFRIYKFRSMGVASEDKGKLTVGNTDLRITRCGRVIRKLKIDELPQLFNVLFGDMSLVGPRPEVPEFILTYPDHVKDKVLSVKPGITDNASILLVDESELLAQYEDPHEGYMQDILPIKQKLYVEYVDNHSLVGDVKIIFKTLIKICSR